MFILMLTLKHHALLDALLKPTVLAPVPLRLGDLAISIRHARVHPPILYGSLEETFTPLAGDDTVVQSRCFVLANHADHWLFFLLVVFQHHAGVDYTLGRLHLLFDVSVHHGRCRW